jgi:phosphoglycolate phosphatase
MYMVVFDCDGTLVDSQHGIIAATAFALEQEGLVMPPREKVLGAVGLPIEVALKRHAPDADADMLARILDNYRAESVRLAGQDDRGQVMFPGMQDIVRWLGSEDNVVMGIVTMKSRRGLNRVVDAYDIRPFFQSLKSADDGPGKPAPDLLLDAMSELGVKHEQTVMVGDTSFDMMMARAAGCYAVGVGWGYQSVEELEESGAHEIVMTPDDLRETLKVFIS